MRHFVGMNLHCTTPARAGLYGWRAVGAGSPEFSAQRGRSQMRAHSDGWISGWPVVIALLLVLATPAPAAQSLSNPKHFFWAPGQPNTPSASALANDLIYHGGNVGSGAIGVGAVPATYLIFCGPDSPNGFTNTPGNGSAFTRQQLQNYVTSFVGDVRSPARAGIHDG